ncbi:hypothetical protein [Mycolicibacterium conceptionense]|uniref:hypothetical protein n=1 Tax=Mycolicibacterium conceptionense TaxID=451644 RepID=UPI00096CC20C|nr:hypothetical protein [Mycolicibacterium conceptionense]OMB79254.1 hypothetical protein A5743_14205 [Mycolicibacterium conceptionense]
MSARKYVYRLVVDHWPTDDGRPFAEQPQEFWERITECVDRPNHQGHSECECPEWLPSDDDLAPYLVKPSGFDYHEYLDPPKFCKTIADPGEPGDYATGYPGTPGYLIIAVPAATPRRRFQRAGLVAAAEQLRAWGCTAHVERAEVGAWEAIP